MPSTSKYPTVNKIYLHQQSVTTSKPVELISRKDCSLQYFTACCAARGNCPTKRPDSLVSTEYLPFNNDSKHLTFLATP